MWRICVTIFVFTWVMTAFSQQEKSVQWLTFEQLSVALQNHPKKVFIDFYADWCAPCLKMQREVFTDSKVIEVLNKNYYAVQMNVETTDTIQFGKQIFVNKRINRRNPIHEIALLMASQKNKPFSLPALVFLDENFKPTARYFQYLNTDQFLEIITY
ncbi:thioredoxin-like protein [Gelidibacter algens]|uniref:Thioredoxin-like protein n=1 Tax=Gelidibacter algens TaxID=49280 RepID=A0A1A7R2V2_9FLAO|nr:thioredoxin family protein [Gelidibacter algens]OBX26166.1 thioredoxin [Gelidibacter algens]RAJ24466.1 thioredoxin-like protein [Gelidibacter algens]